MTEQAQKKWFWQVTKVAYLDAGLGDAPPAWTSFRHPEDAHAAAQRAGWDFGEYDVAEEGGKPIPTIEGLMAEVERLHKVMDWCASELSGTMEYGGVLGALRDREIDPLDQPDPLA